MHCRLFFKIVTFLFFQDLIKSVQPQLSFQSSKKVWSGIMKRVGIIYPFSLISCAFHLFGLQIVPNLWPFKFQLWWTTENLLITQFQSSDIITPTCTSTWPHFGHSPAGPHFQSLQHLVVICLWFIMVLLETRTMGSINNCGVRLMTIPKKVKLGQSFDALQPSWRTTITDRLNYCHKSRTYV